MVILAIDQRDIRTDVGQALRSGEPPETGADNNDLWARGSLHERPIEKPLPRHLPVDEKNGSKGNDHSDQNPGRTEAARIEWRSVGKSSAFRPKRIQNLFSSRRRTAGFVVTAERRRGRIRPVDLVAGAPAVDIVTQLLDRAVRPSFHSCPTPSMNACSGG